MTDFFAPAPQPGGTPGPGWSPPPPPPPPGYGFPPAAQSPAYGYQAPGMGYQAPGFPPPYGYGYPPAPPKKSLIRKPFIIAAAVLGVVIAGGAAYAVLRPHRHLHLQAGAGLTPSADPALLAGADAFNARHLKGFRAAAFNRTNATGIIVAGGDIGDFDDPDRDLEKLAAGVTEGARERGATITPYMIEPAGPRGGKVQCTSIGYAGRAQHPVTICIWTDSDTAGVFIDPEEQTAAATQLASYRQVDEH